MTPSSSTSAYRPTAFAPPYGASNPAVRSAIGRWFGCSVGTTFARANRADDVLDIPRIEMHYFRDPARWRAFLDGRAEWYFGVRRVLRGLGHVARRIGAG